MNHETLKTKIPAGPEEWLEYRDHRDRWTPEMQTVIDGLAKKSSPPSCEERRLCRCKAVRIMPAPKKSA